MLINNILIGVAIVIFYSLFAHTFRKADGENRAPLLFECCGLTCVILGIGVALFLAHCLDPKHVLRNADNDYIAYVFISALFWAFWVYFSAGLVVTFRDGERAIA
jgi:hypothetical protein